MSRRSINVLATVWLSLALAVSGSEAQAAASFDDWLVELRSEALESGISKNTVDAALSGLEPDADVLARDRNQPEASSDFCLYLDQRIDSARVARGRELLARYASLLADLEAKYGVPPRYLVSLWGLESNFGVHQGGYDVIRSLATLAHDPRRASAFRRQLLAALRILDEGHQSPEDMRGSWAGAMGQVQFMPTTFLAYAVDRDGDGRKDIWGSVPDALASAANYLDRAGWRRGQAWGRHVRIPDGLRFEGRISPKASVDEWSRRGVQRQDGGALPRAEMEGQVVLPTSARAPAFLVYSNYHTLLAWNRSTFFGISVGTLADRITGRSLAPACPR